LSFKEHCYRGRSFWKRSLAKNPSSDAVESGKFTKVDRPINQLFSDFSQITSREVGRAWVFALALGTVVIWAITGPFFEFSDTWQLVINTGTTILTFLMVFLIQNSQNRDAAAIQIKLNELIRVSEAHNSCVGLERLTDEEIEEISRLCQSRAKAELAHSTTSRKSLKAF
jgi:low affinity Fe/Cu permease